MFSNKSSTVRADVSHLEGQPSKGDTDFQQQNDIANTIPQRASTEPEKTDIGQQVAQQNQAAAASTITGGVASSAIGARLPAVESVMDLPDEVKANMKGFAEAELDEMLLRIVSDFTGEINADRIIMTLYTRYKRTEKRENVLARLRYLVEAEAINKVEGKRSTYKSFGPLFAQNPLGQK